MTRLPIILLAFLAQPAWAAPKNIPVEVHWSGVPPTGVLLSVDGGSVPLQRDERKSVFKGTLLLDGPNPQRRTLIVQYGDYNHPFDIRVHRFLQMVIFPVERVRQGSCTVTRVKEASNFTDNLADAIKRAVAAGDLISIPEPNACDRDLRFNALRARYRQNAKMAEISNGFFLINRQVENAYRQEARARRINVDQELAEGESRDSQFEARQLVAFRTAAAGVRNYYLAFEVTSFMAARISTDSTAAAIYQQQGITFSNLVAYAQELTRGDQPTLAVNPPSQPEPRF